MPTLWKQRFQRLFWLGVGSVFGLALLVPPMFIDGRPPLILIVIGFLLFFPGMVYLFMVTMWHWKSRYRGQHSDLWGALILIETTGWFKLIYLVRHIIPDARGTGRYAASDEVVQ